MQNILRVLLLILLTPSAYAADAQATAPTGNACMILTAWDATILASTPARTTGFGL